MKYIVSRNVTKEECSWLEENIEEGTDVFSYNGCTYGCISHSGIAVSLIENEGPFFELPKNALMENTAEKVNPNDFIE